jgi:hypothetical protein
MEGEVSMRLVSGVMIAVFTLGLASGAWADKPDKKKDTPPGLAKKGGVPPGLAKKGGLPPGLAKKYGVVPEKAYIALHPKHDDRAWFLIDGRWVLKVDFDKVLRTEVQEIRPRAPVPPPVPLPLVDVDLRVVLFE